MDIVYIVKPCKENEELTYSLRSLKNISHNKVFIVGGCPANINKSKVIHIPTKQDSTKWKNSTNNLLCAIKDERLSEDFILMNDDFFILKKVTLDMLNLDRGPIKEVYKYYYDKYGENEYTKGMLETERLLNKLGHKNPLSYELHIPFIMNKNKALSMFNIEGVKDIPVLHKRTLYGNLYKKHTKTVNDPKCIGSFSNHNYKNFVSSMDSTFSKLKFFLEQTFPSKSIYEK